ncbi:indole-3-glycerol phosphate synthase TrpC [Hanamia caeni]|jgi:indole-3-glycerol phosphate synthase|uniref:indole-3-glycerol-phosphate synthase n=1 Tax=Hanamia caeni TaxID=2294116 RepID=A0A3M9N5W6_9BACT|nr:indole-3-glycerol phosphate synthase TrpC [Hanamia caeni]RNI32707.1 indole-3-glycerol phosphate synthase TrpC [Hanamia caeni]
MNILETIIGRKRIEVEKKKSSKKISELEAMPFFKRKALSLRASLLNPAKTGIIAEFKRKSPSKGYINQHSSVNDVIGDYVKFGASGVSVLTDEEFFGGSLSDFQQARNFDTPILRKDFIIDEYQLIESKAFGADVILLIAACLSTNEVKQLAAFAKQLGLEVLLEIHHESELEHICDETDIVGINNRNLKTFKVDIAHSIALSKKIPSHKIKISESGLHEVSTIHHLKGNGFSGFLMGEKFMKENNPGNAFAGFVKELTKK